MARSKKSSMSRSSEEKDNSAKDKGDWVMHYWASAGRGDFIRLVFEEANGAFISTV